MFLFLYLVSFFNKNMFIFIFFLFANLLYILSIY